ncbi:hypothetical protein RhiirA5_438627 [Rhizophagus irregularis]|uniref:Uncharacterized protein n=1 Tax=Rhizophagus irregularis TaxID=588596 RepID=A0A2N0NIU8_9GLOM|nr:hypothetical protein RhiirA5_438627 [Rhizophagus irregularis]
MNYYYPEMHVLCSPQLSEDTFLPSVVLVSFVKYNRPTLMNLDRPYCSHKTYVKSKSGLCSCLQFPRLSLAWAIAAHKSQGLTLPKAVIDLRKKEFAAGLSFVAISHICPIKTKCAKFVVHV